MNDYDTTRAKRTMINYIEITISASIFHVLIILKINAKRHGNKFEKEQTKIERKRTETATAIKTDSNINADFID